MDRFVDIASTTIGYWKNDQSGRLGSWRQCTKAFRYGGESDREILAIRLGFYLASYGMYRGSAAISRKDHSIFYEIIDRIVADRAHFHFPNHLKCISEARVISDLYRDLKEKLKISKGKEVACDKVDIKKYQSDTLITKIMFGTLCCVPAYDTYVKAGCREESCRPTGSGSSLSFESTFRAFEHYAPQIEQVRHRTELHDLPDMFIIDAYLWQRGFCKLNKQKCDACPCEGNVA